MKIIPFEEWPDPGTEVEVFTDKGDFLLRVKATGEILGHKQHSGKGLNPARWHPISFKTARAIKALCDSCRWSLINSEEMWEKATEEEISQ